MAEYIDRDLIEWYGCNFEEPSCKNRECSGCSHAECSHSQVMQIPTANVVERDEYEKLKKENVELKIKYDDAEKRCCHAMDRNAKLRSKIDKANQDAMEYGGMYRELLSKIDKARAEILKNIYKYSGSGNEVTQAYCDGFKDSLEIVIRNMGE